MAPLANLFERVRRGERVLAVVSTPPRHGKTETLIHGIAYLLAAKPHLQITYIGYGSTFSEDKSRKARDIARTVGVPLSETAWARKNWRTGVDDGGVWATSIDGQLTGQGFHLMLVDDPVKDRATAESAAARDHAYEWLNGTAFTRLEPSGSCIVVQTRWHPDDLAGRLIADGWECINLPAIDDDDPANPKALWPDRWPVEKLREIEQQIGDYDWNSLYQGRPRGRGASVFHDANLSEMVPAQGASRICIGCDFAYSAKTHADYSVAVVLAECRGQYYVLEVVRVQKEARQFRQQLLLLKERYPEATACAYVAATEQGSVEFVREGGLPISGLVARADKFTRALPVAACWNDGNIFLPKPGEKKPDWIEPFLSEVLGFTGVKDRHDDQVDALAAAFDGLRQVRPIDPDYLDSLTASLPKSQYAW